MEHEDDECPHGLGMKAACVLCNGREKASSNAGIQYSFESSFGSRCDWCSSTIAVGEQINMMKTGLKMCDPCATEVG